MLLAILVLALEPPILLSSTDGQPAKAGYFSLSWSVGSASEYELQEADNPQFTGARVRYRGSDKAATITGRGDGVYYFRVREVGNQMEDTPWSEVVAVNVKHHSLQRAWGFFAVGTVVFILSLLTILIGNLKIGMERV